MLISLRESTRRNGVSHVAIRKPVKAARLATVGGRSIRLCRNLWDHVKGPRARRDNLVRAKNPKYPDY